MSKLRPPKKLGRSDACSANSANKIQRNHELPRLGVTMLDVVPNSRLVKVPVSSSNIFSPSFL